MMEKMCETEATAAAKEVQGLVSDMGEPPAFQPHVQACPRWKGLQMAVSAVAPLLEAPVTLTGPSAQLPRGCPLNITPGGTTQWASPRKDGAHYGV